MRSSRVDLVSADGAVYLMELELNEHDQSFELNPESTDRFADGLVSDELSLRCTDRDRRTGHVRRLPQLAPRQLAIRSDRCRRIPG